MCTECHYHASVKENILDKKNTSQLNYLPKCLIEGLAVLQWRNHSREVMWTTSMQNFTTLITTLFLHRLPLQLKLYKTEENIFIYKICLCKRDFFLLHSLFLQFCIGMHRNKLWYNMLTKLKTISEIEMLQYVHVK